MKNPNGPYPGRQLFLGMTADGKPSFAYLVTGRSAASRERKATVRGNSVIMGPIGDAAYDALRHYPAVKWDDVSGVLAVTNGIQTDAIYETYRLLHNVETAPAADYMAKIMEGARHEPDSLTTPRISGVVSRYQNAPVMYISIKRKDIAAQVFTVKSPAGRLTGIATYNGDIEAPTPFSGTDSLPEIAFDGKTALDLAEYLYGISEYVYKGEDIRVCAVGGIFRDGAWDIAHVNRHS